MSMMLLSEFDGYENGFDTFNTKKKWYTQLHLYI